MAGRFAGSLRHRTYCEHLKVATEFKSSVLQRKRWLNSSSVVSSVKIKNKRLRNDDIRTLCEKENPDGPEGVSKLFNQLLELPVKYRTNSVNSALYWFSFYDKIEEALELNKLMEKHGIPRNHSTYSTLAVLYSKSGRLVNAKEFFDQMTKASLTPRARHFAPFVEAAVKNGDLIGAFSFVKDMQSAAINERDTDIYTTLIRACIERHNRHLTNQVLEAFHDFMNYRDLLSNDTLEAIKIWFDR